MKKIQLFLFILLFISCSKIKTKDIDFNLVNNLPIIEAQINGVPVKLLVDSGASLSLIDNTVYKELFFFMDTNVPISIGQGLGGTAYIFGVKGVILTHEGDTLKVTFRGTNLSAFRFTNGIVGIIGSDFLSENNLIIDYKGNKLKEIVLD